MADEEVIPPDRIIWKEIFMKVNKYHVWCAGFFLLGVVLAPKVRQLPVLNKLPSA